jgi:acyl-CoA thioesterase FadM
MPLGYVFWLMLKPMAAEDFTVGNEELEETSLLQSAPVVLMKTTTLATHIPTNDTLTHSITGHFEDKWFVYSMIATYADTNSVGNVYFGMYALFVGKTRELFFNTAMPDFDLKTSKFYILTRSFEHKFVREAREFDTITVKIRVADFNRKFCTLEHQIFGSDNELLGKGKQSLLFVSSKDYSLLDIPSEVYTAFMKYT